VMAGLVPANIVWNVGNSRGLPAKETVAVSQKVAQMSPAGNQDKRSGGVQIRQALASGC